MRYIIGFLVTISLIIVILVLLLRGGSNGPTVQPTNLGNYLYTNGTARLIMDGPIVADANHREVQIDVNQSQVTFTLYQGYQQSVVRTQTYTNSQSAYASFLQALQHSGFSKVSNDKNLYDERGYCPSGNRYIYSFNNAGKDLVRSWSTSCGGQGTFRGLQNSVINLFRKQVPDYSKLTTDTSLDF